VFFTPSEDIAQEIKGFTKHVFDHCTKFVSRTAATPLDQLYVDGFDADQIWEQLRLQNVPLLEELSKRIRSFQKKPEQIRLFPCEKGGEEEEDDEAMELSEEVDEADDDGAQESADSDDDQDDGDEEEQDDSAEKTPKKKISKKAKKARDVAEDGFFDWDEMDRIAEEEEEEDDDDEDEGLGVDGLDGDDDDDEEGLDDDSEDDDMEDEDLDDESAAQMKFDDFFEEPDVKKSKRSRADDDEDEEEDDDDEEVDDDEEAEEDEEENEFPTVNRTAAADMEGDVDEDDLAERGIMSSHQRQRKRLQQEIKQLEKEALEDKPWELKGEVRSGARPENSLLEAVLDYDRPVKVAPVITVEVSVALEDMIKKRILEDDFDDVIRKFAPNEEDEKKKLLDVSMEKSKEGLGEIYEKEYMKTAMGFEADDESKQEQEEIEVMFKSLCWKLDALSNYQFTPKPMVKELQVKPSVPAIAMEEVVPISVSDANLKAPEEVFQKKRKRGEAVLQSKEEMTQDERKAQRGAKKRVRRKERKQAEADERLVAKINPGLGNKYEKKKMLESIANAKNVTKGKEIEGSTKQFTNSKEFFSRLQVRVDCLWRLMWVVF
jgi:U3 small nucleolar RNA-associated protein MPP10